MGFFDASMFTTYKVKYEYGFPEYKKAQPIVIMFKPEGVQFQFFGLFDGKKFIIPHSDIVQVGMDEEVYRSAGKAATGAIIGGILTGGIGLIAGAALGGRRRRSNQLSLIVNYKGQECVIEIAPDSNTKQLYRDLIRVMPKSKPVEIPQIQEKDDVLTQLERLADMKDRGILTQDEFDTQKAKLLS